MVQLQLDDLLRKRIMDGENFLEKDGDKYFVSYNEIVVERTDDKRIHISFMKRGVRVAGFSGMPDGTIVVTGVDARLMVNVEN